MTLRRTLLLFFLFAILPGAAFATAISIKDTGEVLVRLPDQFLDASNFTLPAEGKAIVADLSKMHVMLYENGIATATYPILSKGRKGTPWETPSGVYQVLLKEKTHFSSLGHVFMPWSMQFYGNFFIHGWPYDAEGNDVPRGYSGGCVRLSTLDAEKVYRFADRGVAVIVRANDERDLSGGYYVAANTPPPELSAGSLVVMDLDRGQLLWKKNADRPFIDALTGKYLSALASLEHMNQYTPRELPTASMLGSSWLDRRTTLPAKDLIAPLLYSKDIGIEEVLARAHGKKMYLRAMEDKAKAFGMHSTSIKDLGGASTENVTTTADMAHLLRALDQSKRYLLEITDRPFVAVPDEVGEEPTVVLNEFLSASITTTSRGGLVDPVSGNGLFVLTTNSGTEDSRSLAIAIGGSVQMDKDIAAVTDYLSSGLAYVPDKSDGVVTRKPVGFFAKIRMIWNKKRIGDMLLGTEASLSKTASLTEAFRKESL